MVRIKNSEILKELDVKNRRKNHPKTKNSETKSASSLNHQQRLKKFSY